MVESKGLGGEREGEEGTGKGETERKNINSDTLFFEDCSLVSLINFC